MYNMPMIYIPIFILSILQGPAIAFLSGVTISYGLATFSIALIILVVSEILNDTVWYFIGYQSARTGIKWLGNYLGITEENISSKTSLLRKRRGWVFFITGFLFGLGEALMTRVTAGIVKIPFGRYTFINTVFQLIWTTLLIWLGTLMSKKDRKSTRLNSSHVSESRMPSSA